MVDDIYYSANFYSGRAQGLIRARDKAKPFYLHLTYQSVRKSTTPLFLFLWPLRLHCSLSHPWQRCLFLILGSTVRFLLRCLLCPLVSSASFSVGRQTLTRRLCGADAPWQEPPASEQIPHDTHWWDHTWGSMLNAVDNGIGNVTKALQVILPTAPAVSNEGRSSELLVPLPAVSWPWVPACGSLEPPRRDGENAQKTTKNGEEMGEIRSKR